jgi:hypothetical protein
MGFCFINVVLIGYFYLPVLVFHRLSISTSRENDSNEVAPQWRTVPTKMTSSEAFVETMVAHGTKHIFGIVGSAFMDALDIFEPAGIRFLPVQVNIK